MLSCVKNKARQGRRRKKKNERNKEEVWKKREKVLYIAPYRPVHTL